MDRDEQTIADDSSTIVSVAMSARDAAKLLQAFKEGKLSELGITEVTVLSEDGVSNQLKDSKWSNHINSTKVQSGRETPER